MDFSKRKTEDLNDDIRKIIWGLKADAKANETSKTSKVEVPLAFVARECWTPESQVRQKFSATENAKVQAKGWLTSVHWQYKSRPKFASDIALKVWLFLFGLAAGLLLALALSNVNANACECKYELDPALTPAMALASPQGSAKSAGADDTDTQIAQAIPTTMATKGTTTARPQSQILRNWTTKATTQVQREMAASERSNKRARAAPPSIPRGVSTYESREDNSYEEYDGNVGGSNDSEEEPEIFEHETQSGKKRRNWFSKLVDQFLKFSHLRKVF